MSPKWIPKVSAASVCIGLLMHAADQIPAYNSWYQPPILDLLAYVSNFVPKCNLSDCCVLIMFSQIAYPAWSTAYGWFPGTLQPVKGQFYTLFCACAGFGFGSVMFTKEKVYDSLGTTSVNCTTQKLAKHLRCLSHCCTKWISWFSFLTLISKLDISRRPCPFLVILSTPVCQMLHRCQPSSHWWEVMAWLWRNRNSGRWTLIHPFILYVILCMCRVWVWHLCCCKHHGFKSLGLTKLIKVVHKEDNKQSYDYATNKGKVVAR